MHQSFLTTKFNNLFIKLLVQGAEKPFFVFKLFVPIWIVYQLLSIRCCEIPTQTFDYGLRSTTIPPTCCRPPIYHHFRFTVSHHYHLS